MSISGRPMLRKRLEGVQVQAVRDAEGCRGVAVLRKGCTPRGCC